MVERKDVAAISRRVAEWRQVSGTGIDSKSMGRFNSRRVARGREILDSVDGRGLCALM